MPRHISTDLAITADPLRARITDWRETRRYRGGAMPATMWTSAVALARQHGVAPTARASGIDYAALKRRVATERQPATHAGPTFVDLGREAVSFNVRHLAIVGQEVIKAYGHHPNFYLASPAAGKDGADARAVMNGDRAPVATVQGMGDNLSMVSDTQQRAWMAQWHAARAALDAQRAAELRALSSDQTLAAADGLLSLACVPAVSATRRSSSGLVQQQAILHRRPVP